MSALTVDWKPATASTSSSAVSFSAHGVTFGWKEIGIFKNFILVGSSKEASSDVESFLLHIKICPA